MEAKTLKKILLYAAVAVVLGLLLTLVPLITLAEIKTENHVMQYSFPERLEKLEGTPTDAQRYSANDVKIFAISFVVALVVYVLFKRRTPHRNYGSIRPFPY